MSRKQSRSIRRLRGDLHRTREDLRIAHRDIDSLIARMEKMRPVSGVDPLNDDPVVLGVKSRAMTRTVAAAYFNRCIEMMWAGQRLDYNDKAIMEAISKPLTDDQRDQG